jgi:hypothetical protein
MEQKMKTVYYGRISTTEGQTSASQYEGAIKQGVKQKDVHIDEGVRLSRGPYGPHQMAHGHGQTCLTVACCTSARLTESAAAMTNCTRSCKN